MSTNAKFVREYGGLYSFSVEARKGRDIAASGTIVLASDKNVKL